MGKDYEVYEDALCAHLITSFPNHLSATRCKSADPDTVLTAIFEENSLYGCVLDFGRGFEDSREPFKTQVWVWQIVGIFFVRFDESVEPHARQIISILKRLFENDHTLGGVSPRVRMVGIETPEPTQVNDIPFYFIPFTVEFWDR